MVTIQDSMSVYSLVKNAAGVSELINNVRMMNMISHEIEDTIIYDRIKARVFSGFQRMSSFLPQIKRYQNLARYAETVYVFGHFDITPPPIVNVKYIEIKPTDQLAREWFIVADAPEYFTALVTEELPNQRSDDPDRKFHGIWSFDEELIGIIQAWMSDMVGAYPIEHSKRQYQHHIRLMSHTVNRLSKRIARMQS